MKTLMAFVLVLFCVLSLTGCSSAAAKKPYEDLKASEITAATVRLTPPDVTVQIANIKEFADYLKDVVIYNEDNSYTEYEGQAVTFRLTMADGTQTNMMAYNPFFVIDGVGYRTEYEPCEALNAYANGLLAGILEEPPVLTVAVDETAFDAQLGAYSWQRMNKDGASANIEADSPHPLDCRDSLSVLETTKPKAALRFAKEPDVLIRVQCWSDEDWGRPSANSETVTVNGDEIELKPGGTIYEVTAEWHAENGYGGIAHYAFYVKTIK